MIINQVRVLRVEGESKNLGLEVLTKERHRLILGQTGIDRQRWDRKNFWDSFLAKERHG